MIKSRRIRWAGRIARMENLNGYRILVGMPEGKRPLVRSRHWEHNIKMAIREIDWGDMVWIHLTQDNDQWRTLVNMTWTFEFHKILGNS
jgi:hypothetical protein